MRKRQRSSHRIRNRLPLETERAVRSLCAGYHRLKYRRGATVEAAGRQISAQELTDRIDDALAETCEAGLRETIRADIAERRGAKYTQAIYICEGGYKARKRAAKHAIAKRFGLPTE